MNPTGKTYLIRTINDLIAVPPERRNRCVAEILEGIKTAERAAEEVRAKLKAQPFPSWLEWLRRYALKKVRVEIRNFEWIDDGEFTASVRLQSPFGTVMRHSPDHRENPI